MNQQMNKALPDSAKKVQNFLIANGFACEIVEFSNATRTALEAAQAIGCEVAQIAKSLIFIDQASNNPILVIASGVNQVDIKKIELQAGLQLTKADGKFVKERVGFAIGGVPPCAHNEKLKTFLDPSLLQYEWLWAAAGTPFSVFKLRSDELQKLTNGTFIDFAIN